MTTRTKQQLSQPNSVKEVLKKIPKDEVIFPLRAQDWSAPACIFFWMAMNASTANDEKLRSAFEVALKMRKMPGRKVAD